MTDQKDYWMTAVLRGGATVEDAALNLNASSLQIVLVVDGDDRLLGTVTDGDIRRGMLAGHGMDSNIEAVMAASPMVAPPGISRSAARQLMRANSIRQIPIVDEEHRLVGLHLWDHLSAPANHENRIIIMAGGKGTRLRPYTEDCPKPLLPVAGKPILEHILERASNEGFRRFTFAVHYLGHMIEEHFGDGSRWGVTLDYLREQKPLGTAGALSLLGDNPEFPFVVTNGDVLTDIRLRELLEFHDRHGAAATMSVREHQWQHPFGVVDIDGIDIVGFEEKPIHRTHVNAGIYVLSPEALQHLAADSYCDMPTLFARLRDSGRRTIVFPMHEPWLDVGRPDELAQARSQLSDTQ